MHDVMKKEHDKNKKHNTQDVDNGDHPGGTTYSGLVSRWCRPLH